jgi:hypothetical protein
MRARTPLVLVACIRLRRGADDAGNRTRSSMELPDNCRTIAGVVGRSSMKTILRAMFLIPLMLVAGAGHAQSPAGSYPKRPVKTRA